MRSIIQSRKRANEEPSPLNKKVDHDQEDSCFAAETYFRKISLLRD